MQQDLTTHIRAVNPLASSGCLKDLPHPRASLGRAFLGKKPSGEQPVEKRRVSVSLAREYRWKKGKRDAYPTFFNRPLSRTSHRSSG